MSPFHCYKCVHQKYLWRSRNYQEPSKSILRFLTIVIWNLSKGKKQKFKNTIFDGPLIVIQTFSQTEDFIGKSDVAHIMNFHSTKCLIFVKFENIGYWKMVSVQFRKNFTGPPFCGGWAKNIKLLADISFESSLQNAVLPSLLMILSACY